MQDVPKIIWPRAFTAFAAAWIAIGTSAAPAADVAGSRDHPQVGRFVGSEITFYAQFALDEARLLKAPLSVQNAQNTSGGEWLAVEGRVTRMRYAMPSNRSSFEVLRSYETALRGKGFQTAFTCKDVDCLSGSATPADVYRLGEVIDPKNTNPMMYYDHSRYLLAKRDDAAGPTYVSLLVGERLDKTVAFLQVVDPQQPEPPQTVAKCPQFVGPWRNVDPKTRSMARAEIKGSCDSGKMIVHVWGACTPKYCDWGDAPGTYDAAKERIDVTSKSTFDIAEMTVSLDAQDHLVIDALAKFTDKSGRADLKTTDVFVREK
jgi:hypothetical protein